MAYNKLTNISGLDSNINLTELWLNLNQISDPDNIAYLSHFQRLETIYLADNPLAKDQSVYNQDNLKRIVPSLKQIDGFVIRPGF